MGSDADERDGLTTVASSATLVFVGRVLKLTLKFVILVVLARLLDTTSYGAVVLGVMAMSLGGLFAGLGLANGLSRQIPHYEDDPRIARGVLRDSAKLGLASSLAFGAALFLSAPYLADHVFGDPEITPVFQLAALGIPFKIVRSMGLAVAKGSRDAKPHVVVEQILMPVGRALLVTVPVALGHGAVGAMTGQVTTVALSALIAAGLGYRSLNFHVAGPSERRYGEVLSFSVPLMLSSSMQFVIYNTDRFLIGWLVDSAGTGIYNIAFQLQNVGMFFFFPIAFLLPPVLTREAKEDGHRERRIYQVTSKWMVLLSLPVIAGLLLFPEVVIDLGFGDDYLGAARPLQILMLPVFVTVLLGANGQSLVALGYNTVNMYVNGASAAANVALNVLLIPVFGITGAAIATATSLVFRDVGFTVLLYQYEGIQPLSWAMFKPLALTSGVMGAVYLAGAATVEVTLGFAVLYGVAFGVVHVASVVVAGGIEQEDQDLVAMAEDRVGVDLGAVRSVVWRIQQLAS